MVKALNQALRDSLAEDPRMLVFGEDVARLGGVFRVTDGLQAEFGAERVFDTPLAEAGIADDPFLERVEAEGKDFAAGLRQGVISSDPRPVEELFQWVFDGELPPHLARQRDDALRFAEEEEDRARG